MKQPFEIPNPQFATRANILVVDDDPAVRGFLEDLLIDEGHHVVAVDSGEAALECIGTKSFDLTMIDLKMEGIGGIEVLMELRQRAPDTAAIILTAHGSLTTAIEALRQGAHDYLLKPCKPAEIREKVQSALDVQRRDLRQRDLIAELYRLSDRFLQQVDSAQIVSSLAATTTLSQSQSHFSGREGLAVDLARHVITLDGNPLELSATEFDLLAYMIAEAPRVISAQELVRQVWGHESEPWEARDTVRSHVYHIRQKIASITDRKDIIRTVRGVGYTIGEQGLTNDK